MKYTITALAVAATALCAPVQAHAGDLVFEFTNPSFGGNPLNSGHLLGIANAIKDKEERSSYRDKETVAERFAQTIQSRLLSQVSQEIADRIYGEDAADRGQFVIDSTTIAFERVGEEIELTITDGTEEGSTTILVPAPVF